MYQHAAQSLLVLSAMQLLMRLGAYLFRIYQLLRVEKKPVRIDKFLSRHHPQSFGEGCSNHFRDRGLMPRGRTCLNLSLQTLPQIVREFDDYPPRMALGYVCGIHDTKSSAEPP